jgi:hypothetical protein
VDKSERRELKHQNYPSPREVNPNVPEPLSKLAMWCATFSIGGRPKDMATVVTGLQKISEVLTVVAPPSVSLEAPQAVSPPPPKRPVRAVTFPFE